MYHFLNFYAAKLHYRRIHLLPLVSSKRAVALVCGIYFLSCGLMQHSSYTHASEARNKSEIMTSWQAHQHQRSPDIIITEYHNMHSFCNIELESINCLKGKISLISMIFMIRKITLQMLILNNQLIMICKV